MRRFVCFFLVCWISHIFIFSQVPDNFHYQTILRDKDGKFMHNQEVYVIAKILEGSETGNSVFSETHTTNTSSGGLMSLSIGMGTNLEGSLEEIDWGRNSFFLQIEINELGEGDFRIVDVSQLLTIPYALYAKNVGNPNDADPDSTNEIQNLNIQGNNLNVSKGNSVDLSVLHDGFAQNTDQQTISVSGKQLTISNGNTVTVYDSVNDSDIDSLNEFQNIAYTDNILTISDGNSINMPYNDLDSTNELISDGKLTGNILTYYEGGDSINIDLSEISNTTNLSVVLSEGNDANCKRIINLAKPVDENDMVNKSYIDSLYENLYNEQILGKGFFKDSRDNQQYSVVLIGSLIWMAENLNFDADSSWYYNDSSSNDTLGRLYNFHIATNVCPDGWRLPSDDDWWNLEIALGMPSSYANTDSIEWRLTSGIGTALKEGGDSGFNAKYAGSRYPEGTYHNYGEYARFWTNSEADESNVFNRSIYISSSGINRIAILKESGFSVRCVKDFK